MGVVSSIITGVGAVGGAITATNTVLNEDGTVNRKNRNLTIGASIASTATLAAGAILNEYQTDKAIEEYRKSYVDSLSDEELEKALIQIGELEAKANQDSTNKTI